VILTIDLGTSATKVTLWDGNGPVAVGQSPLLTAHPAPGRAEQDPEAWWPSVVAACAAARAQAGPAWADVRAVVFAAARETFVPIDASGHAIGPALVWSDRRAGKEAVELLHRHGGMAEFVDLTGVVLDAGAMVAKIAWLRTHQPERLAAARWLLAPRDVLILRMTGEVVTDRTLASRTGLYSRDGVALATSAAAFLPPVKPSAEVVGQLRAPSAEELGLEAGVDLVIGAGDRACEVLGVGATATQPMVSWGSTANTSIPCDRDDPTTDVSLRRPDKVVRSAGAFGGEILECGLSAAGMALEWLAALTHQSVGDLVAAAQASVAGAHGVIAAPWLNGARAPWWEPGATAAFLGLASGHTAGDLGRALFEGIAFDVARSLTTLGVPRPRALAAAGGGSAARLWPTVLAAVTNCPVTRRRPELAASAGACLIGGVAVGEPLALDDINPVLDHLEPDPEAVATYVGLRPVVDDVAEGLLRLSVEH
jgi:sugar (pentulose or hexulose) kinase